ncbi:hypothetical protein OROMI_003905 [Orobanche minor]
MRILKAKGDAEALEKDMLMHALPLFGVKCVIST